MSQTIRQCLNELSTIKVAVIAAIFFASVGASCGVWGRDLLGMTASWKQTSEDVTALVKADLPTRMERIEQKLVDDDEVMDRRWQYTWCLIEGDPLSACRRLLSVEDQQMLMRNMQDGDDSHD